MINHSKCKCHVCGSLLGLGLVWFKSKPIPVLVTLTSVLYKSSVLFIIPCHFTHQKYNAVYLGLVTTEITGEQLRLPRIPYFILFGIDKTPALTQVHCTHLLKKELDWDVLTGKLLCCCHVMVAIFPQNIKARQDGVYPAPF